MAAEHRLHPRLRLDVRVDVIGTEVALGLRTDDISLGGCRLLGRAWEAQGTELTVVVTFPRLGASLPLSAIVARATDTDMGLRFHKMPEDQKWALRKHLRDAAGA